MTVKNRPGDPGRKTRVIDRPATKKVANAHTTRKGFPSPAKPASGKPASLPSFAERFKYKGDLYLPDDKYVEPTVLKNGIEKAKGHIRSLVDELAKMVVADGHKISEIELSISFDARGTFLGIGVGGATSIKIKIVPSHS